MPSTLGGLGAAVRLLQLALLVALLHPRAAVGQEAKRDTAEYARADRLLWRADTLARSTDREKSVQALALWHEAAAIFEAGQDSRAVANILPRIGDLYNKLGRPDSALTYYARALSLQRKTGNRSGEARMLSNIGATQHNLGNSDSALSYFARALPIQREVRNRSDEARTLANIGFIHGSLGRPDSALAYYALALPIQREERDRAGEATTLNNIGLVHANLGRPDSALAYYLLTLPVWREMGNRAAEATALNNIGAVQDNLGRPDSALAYYARALPIRRQVGDRSGEAVTLDNIGTVQGKLGRSDSALAYFVRALHIQREARNRPGEANALNNIGQVQASLGRPDSALAYYARALPIQRAVGDRTGTARTFNNIGHVQADLGRPDSALVYYARALPIWRETRNRSGEAATLNNIGKVQGALGRPDSALAYYTRALLIRREVGDRSGEATALNNIGGAQDNLGHSDSALAYFARALPIQREVKNRAGEAATLNNIGAVQSAMGRPDSALAYFARARAIERELGGRANEAGALANIGYMLLRSTNAGSARAAAAAYDTATAMLARMRRRAGGDANTVSLAEGTGYVFTGWSLAWQRLAGQARSAGDSLAVTQAVASSLAAAERGRAQALRDLLDQNRASVTTGLEASDTIPGADLAAEAGRLLAPLRSARVALLYYLTDADTLRAWFLGRDGELQALQPIAQSKEDLGRAIATARGEIGADEATVRLRRGDPPDAAADDSDPDDEADDADRASRALAALSAGVLPSGLEKLLPPGTELVIVPHGPLGQIPFAALSLAGDSTPLGVRNPLRYAPSLRALFASEFNVDTSQAGKAGQRAIVVGNPQMPVVKKGTIDEYRLAELPAAGEEGLWVASTLGTRLLTGSDASERAVRDLIPGASIVHLATHGLAYGTEARVRDSYVALAPGAGEDGFLTLGELIDDDALRLTASLVVLSACQTGLGEARGEEGTVGLQRGLLAKGARSVLVSLWSVDDAATLLLMKRFYTHWLGQSGQPATSKAEALLRAQRDVRAEERFSNPRYWAAFQLVGAN